jgi:uncharacterized protein
MPPSEVWAGDTGAEAARLIFVAHGDWRGNTLLLQGFMLGLEWDEGKRQQNLAEHGVDFADAALIFEAEEAVLEAVDDREDYGEVRYRALGRVDEDHFMVAYTWRGRNRRIISAWRVDEHGRRRYQAILARGAAGDAGPR